jgi:hypothetical protein
VGERGGRVGRGRGVGGRVGSGAENSWPDRVMQVAGMVSGFRLSLRFIHSSKLETKGGAGCRRIIARVKAIITKGSMIPQVRWGMPRSVFIRG